MANYIELATSRYPVSQSQIRAENPQTSYPASFPVPEGYAIVFPAPAPTFDPITQIAREIAPVLTDKGHYEQAYEVIQLDEETATANAERAKTQHNDGVWSRIASLERESLMPRALRDLILANPAHPGYAKVKELDDEINAEKAKLK